MAKQSIEERVAALEADMRQVKSQTSTQRAGVWGTTQPERIDEMFGIFAADPLFDRMVERMRTQREIEQQAAETEA